MTGPPRSAEQAQAELAEIRTHLLTATGAGRTNASLRRLGLLDLLLEKSDDSALVDEAIAVSRELSSDDLDTTTAALVNIALVVHLTERFRRRGDRVDLEEALTLGRARVRAGDDESWLTDRTNLAAALLVSWTYTSRADHLDEAIELLQPAVDELLDHDGSLTGDVDDDRSKIVHNLANAYSQRYDLRRDPADQQRAGDLYRAALPGAAAGTRAGIASALARQLADAYRSGATPRVEVLDEAVTLARSAIDAPGEWHRRAQRWSTLASILLVRFEAGGPEADLDEANALVERMLAGPESAPDRADHLGTASAVAFATYRQRRRREDLERAIALARTALDREDLDRQTAGVLINQLTLSLTERFELDGDRTDLDRAIGLGRSALVHGLRSDVELTISTNLSNALHTRFDLDGDPADLLEAIATLMPALQHTPPSSERADRLSAAGMLYSAKAATAGGGAADLDRAVAFGREALSLSAAPSPDRVVFLANTGRWLSERYEAAGERSDLNEAIGMLEDAHEIVGEDAAIRAKTAFSLGTLYNMRYEGFTFETDAGATDLQRACDRWDEALALDEPFVSVYAGQHLGNVAFAYGMWDKCALALSHTLAARTLTARRTVAADRERARFNVQGTAAVAALAAVRAGDPQGAAVILEQSSATLLAEAYGRPATDVLFEQIVESAQRLGGPLVYLATTAAGSVALIVAADGDVHPVELPLTTVDVERELDELRATLYAPAGLDPWRAAAERLLEFTWRSAVEPLVDRLGPAPTVGMVPVGRLAWLPLTTAGAASGDALCQRTVPRLLPYARSVVATPPWPTRPSAFIAVDGGEGVRRLPSVEREAGLVRLCYGEVLSSIVERPAAETAPDRPVRACGRPTEVVGPGDADRLRTGLAAADVGHLACHLDLDLRDPLSSVVRFGAGVRMADLVRERLPRPTHLVLSACDSGLTGTRLPDEAIGPATVLLAAGARSVVAALWPVDDELTPDFMADYHQRLGRGEDPATALALTQRAAAIAEPPVVWPAFVHIGL